MNTLADSLNFVISTLENWERSETIRVLKTENFSQEQFAFKVRAKLQGGTVLQIHSYYNRGHLDYAYQLIKKDMPLLRWDNKEHFSEISSFPHHFHTPTGSVEFSVLKGSLTHDLPLVLNYLDSPDFQNL